MRHPPQRVQENHERVGDQLPQLFPLGNGDLEVARFRERPFLVRRLEQEGESQRAVNGLAFPVFEDIHHDGMTFRIETLPVVFGALVGQVLEYLLAGGAGF